METCLEITCAAIGCIRHLIFFFGALLFERVLHPCLESNLHLVPLHTECLEGSTCGYQTPIEAKSLSGMVEVHVGSNPDSFPLLHGVTV